MLRVMANRILFSYRGLKLGGCTRNVNTTVGFIGLGNMGTKMAQNLLNKGENLIVYDVHKSYREVFSSKSNVSVASSVKEVASRSSCVVTMLPGNDSVWSVYNDDDGILKNCPSKDAMFIDCSTIDPQIAQKIWHLAKETSRLFLDAPVSGGVVGAEAATLTFMVGGCETTPQPVESLLLKMGARVINCGSSGMGQAVKLCNNMLLGTTMVAVAEAMNLGMKFGLDANILTSVINTSSGRCWASEVNSPIPGTNKTAPSSKEYKGGFKTSLMIKDMDLALNMAEKANLKMTLANTALQVYRDAVRVNNVGDLDFSVVYKTMSEKDEK